MEEQHQQFKSPDQHSEPNGPEASRTDHDEEFQSVDLSPPLPPHSPTNPTTQDQTYYSYIDQFYSGEDLQHPINKDQSHAAHTPHEEKSMHSHPEDDFLDKSGPSYDSSWKDGNPEGQNMGYDYHQEQKNYEDDDMEHDQHYEQHYEHQHEEENEENKQKDHQIYGDENHAMVEEAKQVVETVGKQVEGVMKLEEEKKEVVEKGYLKVILLGNCKNKAYEEYKKQLIEKENQKQHPVEKKEKQEHLVEKEEIKMDEKEINQENKNEEIELEEVKESKEITEEKKKDNEHEEEIPDKGTKEESGSSTDNSEASTDDPYQTSISNEAIQDQYESLQIGSMPSFEIPEFDFKPEPRLKSLEDYTKDPHASIEFLRNFSVYSKELIFEINDLAILEEFTINKSLCEKYSKEGDTIEITIMGDYGSNLQFQQADGSQGEIPLSSDSSSIDKYSDALSQIINFLVQRSKNKLAGSKIAKEIAPIITESNQFQMLHLYALFGLNEKKKKLTEFIQAGISHKNIFNYLLCIADYIKAGLQDAYLEEIKYCYWVIVYILFRKYSKVSPILTEEKFSKINVNDYTFECYELYYSKSPESVNLGLFLNVSLIICDDKNKCFKTNMNFYPCKVDRKKSIQGVLSDYPHYYEIHCEDPTHQSLYAMRGSVNGKFIISNKSGEFTRYGPHYIGVLKANFWGTGFDLFDYGIDLELEEDLVPEGFLSKPKQYGKIQYETNILAEVPRAFKFLFDNPENDNEETTLENVKPKWYEDRGCYCLNFYGRALQASAKNFQLVEEGDTDCDIILMHGKEEKNHYNVDYRSPLNSVQAFVISLAAIGHKRAVG
ncbi:unnamed protein product [Moneuplotes crassus]|uniref:Tubby C-terminal domain-containing protein n=1 Tax=Euplotes crassus TaxID=5936 RepID=A0AAD2CXR4_EUPCR|nr:unnamed protein product [Moneuplotes crassus]